VQGPKESLREGAETYQNLMSDRFALTLAVSIGGIEKRGRARFTPDKERKKAKRRNITMPDHSCLVGLLVSGEKLTHLEENKPFGEHLRWRWLLGLAMGN